MCGRNFADDRIEKHEEICAKTAEKAKKRKVFDMTKARVKGTDAAKYVKSAAHLEKKEAKVSYRNCTMDLHMLIHLSLLHVYYPTKINFFLALG